MSVARLSQSVNDPPKHCFPYRHGRKTLRAKDGGIRLNSFLWSIEQTANDLSIEIKNLALYPVGEYDDFVNHGSVQPFDQGDTIFDLLHSTKVLDLGMKLHLMGLLFEMRKHLLKVILPCHSLPLLLTGTRCLAQLNERLMKAQINNNGPDQEACAGDKRWFCPQSDCYRTALGAQCGG
jgi:hypothetical protein